MGTIKVTLGLAVRPTPAIVRKESRSALQRPSPDDVSGRARETLAAAWLAPEFLFDAARAIPFRATHAVIAFRRHRRPRNPYREAGH
jgi:hypothetical protein